MTPDELPFPAAPAPASVGSWGEVAAPAVADVSAAVDGPVVAEVPAVPATGDDAVDQALAGVAALMAGSPEDQLAAYEAAHQTLQDRLADVEG